MQSRSEQHKAGDSNARPKSLWVSHITDLSGKDAALNLSFPLPSQTPKLDPRS